MKRHASDRLSTKKNALVIHCAHEPVWFHARSGNGIVIKNKSKRIFLEFDESVPEIIHALTLRYRAVPIKSPEQKVKEVQFYFPSISKIPLSKTS